MLFLAILVTALAVAWLVPGRHGRRPLREAARIAMGAASVIAGATHFGNPDPFVQHLVDNFGAQVNEGSIKPLQ